MTDTLYFLTTLFLYSAGTFFVFLFLQPIYVYLATELKIRQSIREESMDGKDATLFRSLHLKKAGTPTGGGILIWISVLIVVFFSHVLWSMGIIENTLLSRGEVYLPLFTLIMMGILGAIDDFWNTRGKGGKKGMDAAPKMFFALSFAILGALWFFFRLEYTEIVIPFWKTIDIGFLAIPLYIFIIVGTANAVNITDGLDGLAGGLLVISFGAISAIAYSQNHFILSIFCGIIVAALVGFLWFNVPPAKFFMGDTGSLALGATLGVIAMMIGAVVVLPLIGFIFVIETLSVLIQITSKKFRNGKKIFHIAPIHHHFEYIGWKEPQIVMRFWIIGMGAAILGVIIELAGKMEKFS